MGDDQENTTPDLMAEVDTESAGSDGSSPAPGLTEAEKLATGNYFRSADGKLKKKYKKSGKLENEFYENEMLRLQEELVKLQYWVKEKGLRVIIVFEGRDAAGKAASSNASPNAPTPASYASSLWASPPNAKKANGTSSAGRPTCPLAVRWSCLTAVGTPAPSPNTSWAFATKSSTRNLCAPAPNLNACWFAPASFY